MRGKGAASFILLPRWPWDVLHNIGQYHHPIPLFVVPGPLLLLALPQRTRVRR
jgi:hypothetical protein